MGIYGRVSENGNLISLSEPLSISGTRPNWGCSTSHSSSACRPLNQLMAFRRAQHPTNLPNQHIQPPYPPQPQYASVDPHQNQNLPPMPQSADVASPTMSNKRGRHDLDPNVPVEDGFVHDPDAGESGQDDDDDEDKPKGDKKAGRRKIKIEFIQDKSRRHITFSKRKAGIMKKAYELSTLTGTQVLLLVVSETGLVYTFTTAKLQPLVTQPEGKNLIQACLNAPHGQLPSSMPVGTPINRTSMPMHHPPNVPGGLAIGSGAGAKEDDAHEEAEDAPAPAGEATDRANPRKRRRASSSAGASNAPRVANNAAPGSAGTPQNQSAAPTTSPHARPSAIPPGAPPIAIPGVPQSMPLEHSPRQGQATPTSPSYAQPGAGYPPPPGGGDPNMYAPPPHQQHGGYPGAPPPQPYGNFGHEGGAPGAPQPAMAGGPWGPPPVQHGNQYAR
ncbi:SRF-type transcription factor (DNA-binding and dimerization domain)-domain-containing protein, partial [Trametes maxima]